MFLAIWMNIRLELLSRDRLRVAALGCSWFQLWSSSWLIQNIAGYDELLSMPSPYEDARVMSLDPPRRSHSTRFKSSTPPQSLVEQSRTPERHLRQCRGLQHAQPPCDDDRRARLCHVRCDDARSCHCVRYSLWSIFWRLCRNGPAYASFDGP